MYMITFWTLLGVDDFKKETKYCPIGELCCGNWYFSITGTKTILNVWKMSSVVRKSTLACFTIYKNNTQFKDNNNYISIVKQTMNAQV